MAKLNFSLILMLVLVSVRCSYCRPVQMDSDTLQELLELTRSLVSADRHTVDETGLEDFPIELWPEPEAVGKRGLPRLGVSIYRPQMSRIGSSSKGTDASKYHLSSPAEQMARLHGREVALAV